MRQVYTKAEFVIYVKFKFNWDILNFDLLKVATVVQEPVRAKTEAALEEEGAMIRLVGSPRAPGLSSHDGFDPQVLT